MKTLRIVWLGQGGELDSVIINAHNAENSLEITSAVINLLRDGLMSAGDSLTIEEVELTCRSRKA